MPSENTEKNDMTIEETFKRIDEIVKLLEDSGCGLEASFALYREGSDLLREANNKIDMVQKQVQVIRHSQHGLEMTTLDDSEWIE